MPVVDYATREVRFRFVVAGAPGAGKAAVLRSIFAGLGPSHRGEISTRPLGTGQLVRFDFTPPDTIPKTDHYARAELLTLSGPGAESAHWSRLLAGTDVLLFVADSQPSRMDENCTALREIAAQPSLAEAPVVFLYSKRDVPSAVPVAEMQRVLNPAGAPAFESTAHGGDGLASALSALCALALT